MKILAPANSVEEVEKVILAGADGIYIGGVTTIYSNFLTDRFNLTIGEYQLSLKEFYKIVDLCLKKKIYIQYNVYTDCISDDMITSGDILKKYIKKYIEIGIKSGVNSLLFDDLTSIILAKKIESKTKLHASFLFDTINTEQITFLNNLGIELVELSPQLNTKEIYKLSKSSLTNLGIISHFNCAAFEGACYLDHFIKEGDKLLDIGITCKAFYQLVNNFEQKFEGQIIDFTQSCSICNLINIINYNIFYIKIPGRHIDFNLVLEWVNVYRSAIELLKEKKMTTKSDLQKFIINKFPRWRIWCRLNKMKGCLYDDENSLVKFYTGKEFNYEI